ncbi:nitrogen permease regulator of amino acid transport activity 3-domain-containing protein [Biscogniauxia marginata]|nr:nitrogen permease regulator of amino acid transport activity 3-domain-containing protein [Biscogniauxia marginata]
MPASPVLPNPSNFLGVALVVNRSRDGPRFVFHYPPHIHPTSNRAPANEEVDELDDDDDALLDQMTHPSSVEASSGSLPKSIDLQNWNHDDHLETDSGSHVVPWEHVAGYPTKDLESLLTPSRAFHKRLFQVSLDQLCFVSYPVYVPENGIWRKKKKQPKYQPPKSPENGDSVNKDGQSAASVPDIPQIETRDMADDGAAGNPPDEAEEKKSGMTMFNLVFILSPKRHEAKELAETLYFHIIKKINKAFKYSQQKSDFVWKESKRILTLKDKNREAKTKMSTLWREILEASSLAACMQDIYEAVSHNKIAALQLDTAEGTITHSVQIPVPFYLTDLPPEGETSSRGLWITTANYFVEEDSLHDPAFLDKNFTLLLMSDEKKIIAELQADADETTAPMIEFVRLSKPTLSFHQIGQGHALSPVQVRKYAQHFIFWRRAIAIPPLHARDVYIMSPNSDVEHLPRASAAWSRAFPLAPPLPNFLAELSAAPRPYKWFAPSKNHRPTYLQMLAWLMRGGWVTQLCTFAYVVVWPEILYEVDYELEAEKLRAAVAAAEEEELHGYGHGREDNDEDDDDDDDDGGEHGDGDGGDGDGDGNEDSREEGGHDEQQPQQQTTSTDPTIPPSSSPTQPPVSHDLLSPQSTTSSTLVSPTTITTTAATTTEPFPPPPHPQSRKPPPAPQPTHNQQAAEKARLERLADKRHRALAERQAAFSRRPPPRATRHPSANRAPHLAGLSPHVVVDARRATGRDSLYLSAIGRRFRDYGDGDGDDGSGEGGAGAGGLGMGSGSGLGISGSSSRSRNSRGDDGNNNNNNNNKTANANANAEFNARVRAAWPVFWKYFDGRSALERVALQMQQEMGAGGGGNNNNNNNNSNNNGGVGGVGVGSGSGSGSGGGMKRKEVWNLLAAMSEYLICVRHW